MRPARTTAAARDRAKARERDDVTALAFLRGCCENGAGPEPVSVRGVAYVLDGDEGRAASAVARLIKQHHVGLAGVDVHSRFTYLPCEYLAQHRAEST